MLRRTVITVTAAAVGVGYGDQAGPGKNGAGGATLDCRATRAVAASAKNADEDAINDKHFNSVTVLQCYSVASSSFFALAATVQGETAPAAPSLASRPRFETLLGQGKPS